MNELILPNKPSNLPKNRATIKLKANSKTDFIRKFTAFINLNNLA